MNDIKNTNKKMKKIIEREDGNIILLFASVLIILIFFVGLSIDMGMLYSKRNQLQDLCQMIRKDRFTYQDTVRYAENPAQATFKIAKNTLSENDFNGQMKIYFWEKDWEDGSQVDSSREYMIRTELTEDFSFVFLQILGFSTIELTVHADGKETYGEGGMDMIWHPSRPVSTYNGYYTTESDYPDGGDMPAEWEDWWDEGTP